MLSFYIVHELELDDTRRGARGEQDIDGEAAIKFKTKEVGCFIAPSPSAACKLAAQAVERPGKFLATAGDVVHAIELGQAREQKPKALKKEVKKQRARELENARRNGR